MKGVIFHAILAAGGLWFAYQTWTEEDAPVEADDLIEIFACDASKLTKVTVESEQKTAVLEPRREGSETLYWISVTRKSANAAPETDSFVGNDKAEEYVDAVAPLMAIRSLGQVSEKQLEEFELKEPKTSLTVECDGRTFALQVGGTTYGAGDQYARTSTGEVFILKPKAVSDLENASSRLMQRELFRFETKDIDKIAIAGFGAGRTLQQHNRLDPRQAAWVDAAAPDRVNDLYGNWVQNRLEHLRVQNYLPVGAEPGSELDATAGANKVVTSLLTLTYTGGDGEELGKLELVRVDAASKTYYARTSVTRGWVTVPTSAAEKVEEEVRPVLGLEELPAPEDASLESSAESTPPVPAAPAAPPSTATPPTRVPAPASPPHGARTAPARAAPAAAHGHADTH